MMKVEIRGRRLRLNRDILFVLFTLSTFNFQFSAVCAQDYKLSKADTADVQYLDGKRYYILKVDKNETLYSICKRFNVSQDTLTKINPWLKDGLKVKSKVWIPAKGPVAKTAVKAESEVDKSAAKPLYNVAVLLPLNLPSINYDFTSSDSVPVDAIGRETLNALELYEGIQYAVDSLVSKDSHIHLSVYDTDNDSLTTSLLLKEWRLKDVDFIISQNNSALQKMINHYSSEHHIPLFTFNLNATELLKGNSYGWALQPSSYTQCYEAGKFAGQRFKNVNAVIVKTSSSKESERATAFQLGWTSSAADIKPRSVDFTSLDSNLILKTMVKDKNNVVFVSSSNEDVVNPLLLALIPHKDEYQMTIIGLPTWQFFESIDMEVLETLNTHIFMAARHNNADLQGFRDKFRRDYLTEPIDAALQGFDLMMLIGKNFIGKKASATPDSKNYNGIFTNYTFLDSKGTHENNFISVWKYRNGELVEIR
jgi:ABC-type branched-subunit amino acid transport system substrate-binding protein